MEFAESVLIAVAIGAMGITLLLSIIPMIPGPAILWAIGVVFAILTDFQRATPAAIILMTLLMTAGSTTEIWMPMLGIQSKGMPCLSVIGGLFGSILGTILLPIPLVGTITGAVAGSLLVEFVRIGDVRKAVEAGRSAFGLYLVGFAVEFVTCLIMFGVFIVSLWTTG
ncbi:MAG: DUF456 domain-containing protein [Chloroflexi bacterium]|nr:DUF456 domain-containing protein [Chloroflexota bacterium]